MRRLFGQVLLSIWVLGLFSSPCMAREGKEELLIGIIPEMNVFAQMERFRPLGRYLSEKTGKEVKLTILSRYGNILDSFTAESMDAAFFGSFTGALAIQKLGVVPLARPVNLDGVSTYHGLLFVRKDSGIKGLRDMKGKRFAFVERATTAGYLFPLALMKHHGIENPDTYFSEYYFTGSHDAAVYAVLDKKADMGVAKNTVFNWVRSTEPRVDRELEILSRSVPVPSNGLCVRKDLDEEVRRKLKDALLELGRTSEGKAILEKFRALRFVETSAQDYAPVLDLAREAGIDLSTYEYRNE